MIVASAQWRLAWNWKTFTETQGTYIVLYTFFSYLNLLA